MSIMICHGLFSPIAQPVFRRMNELPAFSEPWLIAPFGLLSALGCFVLAKGSIIGYMLLLASLGLGFLFSPMPYQNLIPLCIVTIPYLIALYSIYNKSLKSDAASGAA